MPIAAPTPLFPDEVVIIEFQFNDDCLLTSTALTGSATIVPASPLATDGTAVVNTAANTVRQAFHIGGGATLGTTYVAQCQAVTADGQTLQRNIGIRRVVATAPAEPETLRPAEVVSFSFDFSRALALTGATLASAAVTVPSQLSAGTKTVASTSVKQVLSVGGTAVAGTTYCVTCLATTTDSPTAQVFHLDLYITVLAATALV